MVTGDALDHHALSESLVGVDTAHYRIHSMSCGAGFHETDIREARTFWSSCQGKRLSTLVDWASRKPSCPCTFALGKRQDRRSARRVSRSRNSGPP